MSAKLIIEALAAIPKIFDGIKEVAASINKLRDAITEKNIEGLKTEVSEQLSRIANAKNNKERKELIAELNDMLSR